MSTIFDIEQKRIDGAGSQNQTLQEIQKLESKRQIQELSPEEAFLLLQYVRILVSENSSLAKRTWNGTTASKILRNNLDFMDTFYKAPDLVKALEFTTDSQGNEYFMGAEVLRDLAGYNQTMAQLTGHMDFLKLAEQSYVEALNLVDQGTSTQLLLFFEKAMNEKQLGEKLNQIAIRRIFIEFVDRTSSNHDRVAAIAVKFLMHSLQTGHIGDAYLALKTLRQATSHGDTPTWDKYLSKDILKKCIAINQKLTYQRQNA